MISTEQVPLSLEKTLGFFHGQTIGQLGESLAEVLETLREDGYEVDGKHISLIRGGRDTGIELALALTGKHLPEDPSFRNYNTHNFYRLAILLGTDDRLRERTPAGRYRSMGFTKRIVEEMRVSPHDPDVFRSLLVGLRVSGVYLGMQDPEIEARFFRSRDEFLEDISKIPPSEKTHKTMESFRKTTSIKGWYKKMYDYGSRTLIGSFTPYEFDYWRYLLEEMGRRGDKPMPFSLQLLEFCSQRNKNNQDLINTIQADTGVKINRKALERHLALLSSDFPKELFE